MVLRTKVARYPVTLPVTQKGQVTIPAAMRHQLGITSPGHVAVFMGDDGDVHVRPIPPTDDLHAKYAPRPESRHLSMDQIIEESLADQADAIMRDMGD